MEAARDLAHEMQRAGKGIVLDQFGNLDNPLAHMTGTGRVEEFYIYWWIPVV